MVWEELSKPTVEFVPLTLVWWEDFKASQGVSLGLPRQSFSKMAKPPIGFVKLNVDVAFNDSGIASLSGVFRDSNGSFFGGFCHYQLHVSSARHAELVALLLGVEVARSLSQFCSPCGGI